MDLMSQSFGAFRWQLRAVGRLAEASKPMIAKAATATFNVKGLNAAVKNAGDMIPTPREAKTIAIIVSRSGQRDFQKMINITAKQTSVHPNTDTTVSK
jgi:hypothetical protein